MASAPRPLRRALDAAERGAAPPQLLRIDGRPCLLRLTKAGLEWQPAGGAGGSRRGGTGSGGSRRGGGGGGGGSVPYAEMVAVRRPKGQGRPPPACLPCLPCLRSRPHRLELLTFRRQAARPCEWAPRTLLLDAPDEEAAADLAAAIGSGIEAAAAAAGRPRSLLVLLNPNAGRRHARSLYSRTLEPLLAAAGIKAEVRETARPGHAEAMVAALPTERLRGLDGAPAACGACGGWPAA